MKKIYFVLFFLSILANVSLSAQTVDNSGVRYRYNPEKFIVNGLDVDNLNIDDLDVTEVEVLTSDDGEDVRPGEVCIYVTVKNPLIISGRDRVYPVTSWEFLSTNVVLKSVSVDDTEEDNMINSKDKKFDLVDEQYHVTGDVNKSYWVIYHMTKKYQRDNVDAPKFERGNEISHTLKDVNNRNISDDIFYYVNNGVYYPVTKAFATDYDNEEEPEFSYRLNKCSNSYDTSIIDKPIINGTNSSTRYNLTISSDIVFFSEDAFVNCRFREFIVESGNKNFSTIANNKVLCRNENGVPVEVICVAFDESLYQGENKKNVIELPASISKISDFACKNIYDDIRFYTPIYVEFNNNLPGNERVHFDHPSVSCNHSDIECDIPSYVQLSSKASAAKYLVNAKASTPEKPQVITPSETQENIINGLAGNNGICYIDLTTCEAAQSDSKTFSSIDLAKVNRNCLLFLPEGATSDATNVVCMQADGSFVCENLELSRANGVPFQNPYPFKTKSVTITDYQIGANLAGLVLPFDFSNENVNLAVYKGFSDDCIDVTTVESVPANTPFVTRSKDGSSVTITMSSAEGITIYPTTGLSYSTDANGWCMAGTYRTITNSGYNGTTLYGFSKNALAKVNGATFKPFSGYFVKEANASEAKIRFVEDSETTGIVESNNSSKITVSNNSIIISGIQNAVVSTVSGSVLYNGPVNGTKTISVQPGVYVVNGLKVIVNY